MKIQTGYLYHIKDEFFNKINDKELMINHDNGHSRPSYLALEDRGILWFIPLSTKVKKYKKIINAKIKKYGVCKTILIKKIAGQEQAILIQNAFPTTSKYIQNIHTINKIPIKVPSNISKEILKDFKYVLFLKEKKNINLFFTNIDKIKEILDTESQVNV